MLKRNLWTGIYYPDLSKIEDQRTWVVSPPLYSLSECQEWVKTKHKQGENYDYSCSQGCKFVIKFSEESMICRSSAK